MRLDGFFANMPAWGGAGWKAITSEVPGELPGKHGELKQIYDLLRSLMLELDAQMNAEWRERQEIRQHATAVQIVKMLLNLHMPAGPKRYTAALGAMAIVLVGHVSARLMQYLQLLAISTTKKSTIQMLTIARQSQVMFQAPLPGPLSAHTPSPWPTKHADCPTS